jgi:hypothetical protein
MPYWASYINITDVDIRSALFNGRDGKAHSLLYDAFIKQPGWSREFYCGIKGRRHHKKMARRHRRREKINLEE